MLHRVECYIGAIASWLGFEAGNAEKRADDERNDRRSTAKAEAYILTMLASGKYSSYADAKAAMQDLRPSWAEKLGGEFENETLNTISGKHGDRPTYATIGELQQQRKEALTKWNSSSHFTGHGMRYGSLFWDSEPTRVTAKYDQEIQEARYRAIANKYLAAYISAQANNHTSWIQSHFRCPTTSKRRWNPWTRI